MLSKLQCDHALALESPRRRVEQLSFCCPSVLEILNLRSKTNFRNSIFPVMEDDLHGVTSG